MVKHHYLHRPIIRSKMLAYGIRWKGNLIGGLIWANPPMAKKRGLFGYSDVYDRWEVLTLARFFKLDGYSHIEPSKIMALCLGQQLKKGKHGKVQLPFGWQVQIDWVNRWPPIYPNNPFVPRLLLSWSDVSLPTIDVCPYCGKKHNGQHIGTIYNAAGWQKFDQTTNVYTRSDATQRGQTHDGYKQSWIFPLDANPIAENRGLRNFYAKDQSYVCVNKHKEQYTVSNSTC